MLGHLELEHPILHYLDGRKCRRNGLSRELLVPWHFQVVRRYKNNDTPDPSPRDVLRGRDIVGGVEIESKDRMVQVFEVLKTRSLSRSSRELHGIAGPSS